MNSKKVIYYEDELNDEFSGIFRVGVGTYK